MNFISRTLNKIFKSSNQQELDRIKPLINHINKLESEISLMKDDEFKEKTNQLKKNIKDGRGLESILPKISSTASFIFGESFLYCFDFLCSSFSGRDV